MNKLSWIASAAFLAGTAANATTMDDPRLDLVDDPFEIEFGDDLSVHGSPTFEDPDDYVEAVWTVNGVEFDSTSAPDDSATGTDLSLTWTELQSIGVGIGTYDFAWTVTFFDGATNEPNYTGTESTTLHVVPEPASAALLGLGLVALRAQRRAAS